MPLAPIQLDDLTWTDMIESVRRRIPGASEGLWTHHAPVDPGITLLELFAWLIEQRIYWIDQVPADVTHALFSLLGEKPRGALSATTALACEAPAGAPFYDLPAGVEFRFSSVDAELFFTSKAGAVLAPVARMGLQTSEGDRSANLRTRRPIPLMAANGAPSEFLLVFWLAHAGPIPAVQEKLSTLLQIESFNRVLPQWAADATSVQPPACLTWSYSIGAGAWRDLDSASVEDGTGGLRRSGVVRLPLAPDWTPMGPAVGGQSPYGIRVRTAAATFTSSPVLLGLSPNAVIAEHWKTVDVPPLDTARQARNWLKLPDQRLQLPTAEPLPLVPSVRVDLRERDGHHDWMPALDFAFADNAARLFVVDREGRTLHFGDGVAGRIPVPHDTRAPEIRVVYRAGGGLVGNVGPSKRWVAKRGGMAIEASNSVPATGGADPETLADASVRIAAQLKRRERAVTRLDYEELALLTPDVAVARALAVIGLHPLHPCMKTPAAVTVFVVPSAPRPDAHAWMWPDGSLVAAPLIDPGALAAVMAHIEKARLLGSQVFIRPAAYRAVSLHVEVAASPADAVELESRLSARLSRYLDPLQGGDAGGGLPFGEPVRPSALLRIAQHALTGDAIVDRVVVGLDDEAPAESCRDLEVGPYELVYLRRLTVAYHNEPSAGGLP
jgi:baseplate J-like protein